MARRRMTVKRIDPWSVLKFGVVVNLAMLAIGLLVLGVVFFFIDRLRLIDQVCEIAFDVGFTACGLNIANLFRASALLGLLGVIVLTAVLVFLSFLHNLIADLTGGLTVTVIDDGPPGVGRTSAATVGRAPGETRDPRAPRATRAARAPARDDAARSLARDDGARDDGARNAAARDDAADQTAALDRSDTGDLFGGR